MFSKQIVILDSKGIKSGYICQFALLCLRNKMLQRGLVWIWSFLKSWCLELRTLVQVTSATAFDSSLFSNQKRVSVWVSLKACPEIGSISLYTRRTGTVCNLTGSRSSYLSSMDLALYACVWVCACVGVCGVWVQNYVLCLWNTRAQSATLSLQTSYMTSPQHIFTVYDIIYPLDILIIISFSPAAKETPSYVAKHSRTLSIDFPQETEAWILKWFCCCLLTQWSSNVEISYFAYSKRYHTITHATKRLTFINCE